MFKKILNLNSAIMNGDETALATATADILINAKKARLGSAMADSLINAVEVSNETLNEYVE